MMFIKLFIWKINNIFDHERMKRFLITQFSGIKNCFILIIINVGLNISQLILPHLSKNNKIPIK